MGDLGAWLSLLIIAVLVWKIGSERLGPIFRPVVLMLGQAYHYAAPLVQFQQRGNEVETKIELVSEPVTALESGVTEVTEVSEVTLQVADIVLITTLLGKGMSPSRVAKELTGYTPKRYKEFAAKVDQVNKVRQAILGDMEIVSPESATKS